jgi:23S rRNA pseudouridine1911/1915/1917 synthase
MTGAGQRIEVTVTVTAAGERLDRWLAAALKDHSRSRIKALIEAGRVMLAGATITDPSLRVKPGQTYGLDLPEPEAATPQPEKIPLVVLYEDAHLIVIDKPAGMTVHPAPGSPSGTLVNALIAHCGDSLSGIGGVRRPGIVHRLDKDTTGIMVAAKTDRAHQDLSRQFAQRTVERSYLALVWGVPERREGVIEGNIGRDPHDRKRMAVVTRGGKAASTHYRVRRAFALGAALLECRLGTGRTHQIRVHLAGLGHPLVGDATYGRITAARLARVPEPAHAALRGFARQALHANLLGFRHPASEKWLEFATPPPADMAGLLKTLE